MSTDGAEKLSGPSLKAFLQFMKMENIVKNYDSNLNFKNTLPRKFQKTMSARKRWLSIMKAVTKKHHNYEENERRVRQIEKGMLTVSSGVKL